LTKEIFRQILSTYTRRKNQRFTSTISWSAPEHSEKTTKTIQLDIKAA